MSDKRNLNLLSFISAARNFAVFLFTFSVPIYLKNHGLSGYEIGFIYALNSLTGIITILPIGLGNDRLHSRYLISIGLFLVSLKLVGLTLSTQFYYLLFIFFVAGIGDRFFNVSSDSLAFRLIGSEHKSTRIGKYISVRNTAALGTIIGGYLVYFLDFHITFLIAGGIYLLLSLLALKLPRNAVCRFKLLHYKKDVWNKEVLFFLIIMFLFSLHFGAETTSYGLFVRENLKLNYIEQGFYMGIPIIALAVGNLYFSRQVERGMKVIKLLSIGFFCSGLGHVLMTINSIPISFFFRVVHELGDGAAIFFMYFGISQLFPLERVGGNSSIIMLVTILGGFVGALCFGPLGANYGYHFPLIISGVIALLCLPLFWQYRNIFKETVSVKKPVLALKK